MEPKIEFALWKDDSDEPIKLEFLPITLVVLGRASTNGSGISSGGAVLKPNSQVCKEHYCLAGSLYPTTDASTVRSRRHLFTFQLVVMGHWGNETLANRVRPRTQICLSYLRITWTRRHSHESLAATPSPAVADSPNVWKLAFPFLQTLHRSLPIEHILNPS